MQLQAMKKSSSMATEDERKKATGIDTADDRNGEREEGARYCERHKLP